MAFYKADKSKASTGFAVIPAGKYECFIESGQDKVASTGSPMIEFKLKIRDDIEGQEFGGRVLFGRLVFTENTEGIVNGFLQAIGVPDGHEFQTIQELVKFSTGKAVLANVKVTTYKGEERNEVSYMNESKVGGGKIEDPFANDNDVPPVVDDSDLPF